MQPCLFAFYGAILHNRYGIINYFALNAQFKHNIWYN